MLNIFNIPDDMENKCENFKPRNEKEQILVKNLHLNPIKDREYYVYRKIDE